MNARKLEKLRGTTLEKLRGTTLEKLRGTTLEKLRGTTLEKLRGTTLERATSREALADLDIRCDLVLKPVKYVRRKNSELSKARQRYIYGLEDETP